MSADHWFIFDNSNLLLSPSENTYKPLTSSDVSSLLPKCIHQHLLNAGTGNNAYCASLIPDTSLPGNIIAIPLRKALNTLGEKWYSLIVKSYSVIQWDKNHQYCGRCGNRTEHQSTTFERKCTNCQLLMYPRISPSIIVCITKQDKILMARSPHYPPGTYGLIAGFVEAGENLEETVHREVKEEIGIQVKNLHYHSSQPWPFPDSLMIGFTAEYAGGELIIDHQEIEHADWYSYDKLPGWPSSSISIAHTLINDFVTKQTSST